MQQLGMLHRDAYVEQYVMVGLLTLKSMEISSCATCELMRSSTLAADPMAGVCRTFASCMQPGKYHAMCKHIHCQSAKMNL